IGSRRSRVCSTSTVSCPAFFLAILRKRVSFFFSSRRRHTSSLRDWSSDVCSSDLPRKRLPATPTPDRLAIFASSSRRGLPSSVGSEERRVGKECRDGWAPFRLKEKRYTNESGDHMSIVASRRRLQCRISAVVGADA